MHLDHTNAGFQTTQWTLLGRLQNGEDAQRAAALDAILRAYWPAVYASLRRSGRSRDQAAELTQAFFAEVALGRGLFDGADQSRGRLRTLVLTALKRFAIDQHRRNVAGAAQPALPIHDLGEEESLIALSPEADPDSAFDRRWALAMFHEALARAEQHFRSAGKARHWEAFAARIVGPAIGNCPPVPLAQVAQTLDFPNPADAAAAVQTVKKRLIAILRELAAETTEDPDAAQAEYERIVELLA